MKNEYIRRLLSLISIQSTDERAEAALQLWESALNEKALPIIDGHLAYFLHYGDVNQVHVAGDWTFWQLGLPLERIEHTNLFYAIKDFPDTARLQYKIVADGSWFMDPANNRTSIEGFGMNSEFWMSKYQDSSYQYHDETTKKGAVVAKRFHSPIMGESREALLYMPPIKPVNNQPLPVMYIQDGREAVSIGHFNRVLDNMINSNVIAPCLAVFSTPNNRMEEYPLNERYIKFSAEELPVWAAKQFAELGYAASSLPKDNCITGASLGGLVSTRIALRYPELFGVCMPQSPSYWWNHGDIFRSPYLRRNAASVKFILQTGTVCDARQLTLMMKNSLLQSGSEVVYQEFHQGHTWGNWRSNFAEGASSWLRGRPNQKSAA